MVFAPRDDRAWRRTMERRVAQAEHNQQKLATAAAKKVIVEYDNEQQSDMLTPTAPIELTYQSSIYRDPTGRLRARFIVDFPDVVKSTTGQDIVVSSYEIAGRTEGTANHNSAYPGANVVGQSFPGTGAAAVVPEDDITPWANMGFSAVSGFRLEDLNPGDFIRFRVRAFNGHNLNPGQWSAEILAPLEMDRVPPPQPTAPRLEAVRGTIVVTVDGQSVLGSMPADMQYIVLAHGTTTSPTQEVARFGRNGGIFVLPPQPDQYYKMQFFRAVAVDESGNYGPWSEQAADYPRPLVDEDIILSKLDAAETELLNVDARISIKPDTITVDHLRVTKDMVGRFAEFLEVDVGMLRANEIWADAAWIGMADAKLVRSDMFIGKEFEGGRFYGGSFETTREEFRGVKVREGEGITAYSASGAETFRVDSNTGDVTAIGGTFTGSTYRTKTQANRGIVLNDSVGLISYGPTGERMFQLSATNGRAYMVGRLHTGLPNEPGAALLPANESENAVTSGVFISQFGSLPGGVTAGMWIHDSTDSGPQNLLLRGMNNGHVEIAGNAAVNNSPHLYIRGATSRVGNFANWAIGNGDNYLPNLEVFASSGSLKLTGAPTTSAAANCVLAVSPEGYFYRSTSSIRYKMDPQPWNPDYRVLELEEYSWVDRQPLDPTTPDARYYGYLAEQVHRVLPEMVTLNEHAEPESVDYERLTVALIPVVRDIHYRVEDIENLGIEERLKSLEERVSAWTSPVLARKT